MPNRTPYDMRVENEVLRRHQEVLIGLAWRAAESVTLDTFLDELAVRVSQAIEIDHVKILRYRPERGDLFVEAGVGWRPGVVKTAAFPVDMASPPGRAFQTAQPVSIDALQEQSEFRTSRILEEHGIVSLANVPILVDGACWGVMEADSAVLRNFSPDTSAFMTACAALAGLVIRRTQAEAAQARAMAETAREAQRRELLLREMHHRVKNNFQTILAMIAHKARNAHEEARQLAHKIGEGIFAMSLAHDQLAPTRGSESVQLRTYLKALVTSIEKPLENITIEIQAEDMVAGIDQAVPIGLIVNEAVTNAVKHAFDPETGGAIRIVLRPVGAGEALLEITDNGRGAEPRGEGSGSKLMEALARQMLGKLDRSSGETGTTIALTFPRPIQSRP